MATFQVIQVHTPSQDTAELLLAVQCLTHRNQAEEEELIWHCCRKLHPARQVFGLSAR